MVRASDVSGAVSSLKASMGDGPVDLNEVIDMLTSLLRGAGGSEVGCLVTQTSRL